MAKVLLQPMGSPLGTFMSPAEAAANSGSMEMLEMAIAEKRAEVKAGWGEEYVKRVHAKGKLTTWERLELLKDPGTEILPIGTFVNYGREFGEGKSKKEAEQQAAREALLCLDAGEINS